MHFHTYLDAKLQESGCTRTKLAEAIGKHHSTISLWLSANRVPEHTTIKQVVKFFSTTKRRQADDLHIIYFGCDDAS